MRATWRWAVVHGAVCTLVLFSGCTARDTRATDAGPGGGAEDTLFHDSNTDVGELPDTPMQEFNCTAVDVLFVVDDSGSMADQQDSLLASFDGFVSAMRSSLAGATSFHVGVVTPDDYSFNEMGCRHIGDLVTQTGGPSTTAQTCGPFPSGGRYLDGTDPDLATEFACAGHVGTGGSDDERMARALLNAIDPTRACNTGFLRPDSVLVVVMITDEDDVADGCDPSTGICMSYGTGGTPDDWFAEFMTHRDPATTVVLSLLGLSGANPCGATPASHLLHFTHLFGMHGHEGDVCAPSYDAFFSESVPIIGNVCHRVW